LKINYHLKYFMSRLYLLWDETW